MARIEVVLRRSNKTDNILRYDYIELDVAKHLAKLNEKYISLTPKEFELTAFFIKNIDIVITRDRLISSIWGYEFQGQSRTVDIHVQQIRKKLNLTGKLVTIPKLGYRLESRD
ncbi:MAG: response regulator transcription factor [Clostridia bacterium]